MKEQKRKFELKKGRAAGAVIATAAILLAAGLAVKGEGMETALFAASVLAAAAAGLFILFHITLGKIPSAVLCLVLPAAAFFALENYTHVITDLDPPIIILNLLFFYLLYGLLAFLCGSVRLGYSVATLVPMLFGLTNYFVVSFRGSPIVPWDLLSLGTAVSVADNYTFTIQWKQALVLILFVWIIVLAQGTSLRFRKKKLRFSGAFILAICLCLYLSAIQKSQVQSFFGMDTTLFTLNVLYRNNGIAAAFLGNLRFLHIEEPSGYSQARVEEIESAYPGGNPDGAGQTEDATEQSGAEQTEDVTEQDGAGQTEDITEQSGAGPTEDVTEQSGEEHKEDAAGQGGTVQTAEGTETGRAEAGSAVPAEYPNIIVIMDEAFSDLSVWGDFETSEEVLPFFKMMQDEAVGGELYVSVKGGNTANTEFEFLTGDTMGFLPAGSIPYQQYISHEMPSLASQLKSLGYSTTAIHPYNASGWDRDVVYPLFGFDRFLSLKNFVEPHRMRGYVSDRAAFDKVLKEYERKKDGEKQFFFLVTMQNHGGYSKPSPDFDSYLKLTEVEPKTTSILATEKYLTLMNETDRALQDLILYLQEQEEPTVVVMFGDHQPSDYITNAVQRICNVKSEETLDYMQQGYRVPFLIWSNYGLEHRYYDGISVNYLGSILMKEAGLPLSGYQQFLADLMETFPVVNGNVYRDGDGTFYSYGENEKEDLLKDYKTLQYNHLVDWKHRDDAFFGVQQLR